MGSHRRTIAAVAAILLAAMSGFFVHASARAATSICGDSWGSDGHTGPWYVGSNQSLHGNTLVISCPGASTAWNVTYAVYKTDGSGGSAFSPIFVVRNGNGDASFSVSTNPVGCNQGWLYYTQVKNDYTGNYIRKPQAGKVIC